MTKDQAKHKINTLIERYNSLTPEEKRMNEETTKTKFIRPLFEALGWDFEEDVLPEDKISRGRVDYNFRIDGRTKFFLEAKPLKADIDDTKHAKQAANYAWLKNVSWAVLTDFEGIRIFYPAEHGQAKACFHMDLKDYLTSFNDLWILSKESFGKDLIEQQAIKWGAKPERVKVSEQLAKDMDAWRQGLLKHFKVWNKGITGKVLDEGVQRILDRLIFVRSCEDRGLENDTLRSKYRIWQERGRKGNFLTHLKPFFSEYQKNYNSGLFDDHPCMDWEISSECFDEIIEGLYRSKNGQEYNFAIIDADALGSVYEQYLGYLLKKSGDGDISKKKRKSQGIYYTPTFIVDYIVQNTLGKILQEKSPQEIAKLKILDPACGSGSFLIKTFDLLANYYFLQSANKKFDPKSKFGKLQQAFRNRDGVEELSVVQKMDILRNNLYGVDLDQQAVEIAQLNLMLKTLERKQKLPHLNNIKCGNSLIDDPRIAGDKAFNWNEQFSEVMHDGGFDVIIGNPPWVTILHQELGKQVVEYIKENYIAAQGFKMNLFPIFVEKALKLLKKNGILGLIVPNRLLDTPSFNKIRGEIIKNNTILSILDLPRGSFDDVVAGNIVICIQKKNPLDNLISIQKLDEDLGGRFHTFKESQNKFNKTDFVINITKEPENDIILTKIRDKSVNLKDLFNVHVGAMIKDKGKIFQDQQTDKLDPIVVGRNFERYNLIYKNYFNPNEAIIFGGMKNWDKHKIRPKILVRKTGKRLVAFLDREGIFAEQSVYLLLPKVSNYDILYSLCLINSRLINFYFNQELITNPLAYPYIQHYDLEKIPIKIINFANQKDKSLHCGLVELATKIMLLNKKLQTIGKGTNRWNQLKSEINRIDRQIDQLVYELYDLAPEEIKIIEANG